MIDSEPEIEDGVGLQGCAVNAPNPSRIHSADHGASNQGINITIRKYDESGAQCWNDLILEAIHKVRSVKKALCNAAEIVPFFGTADSFTGEWRAGHPGVEDGVPQLFQPRL